MDRVGRKHVLSHDEWADIKKGKLWSCFCSGQKNKCSIKNKRVAEFEATGAPLCRFQTKKIVNFLADKSCWPQVLSTNSTNKPLLIRNSTTLQNIQQVQQRPFFHTLSCHDGGRPGGYTYTYIVLYYTVTYVTNIQSCFIQAIRTFFFISNNQKYMRSTHAVETIYINIKNKPTNTYTHLLKSHTQSH